MPGGHEEGVDRIPGGSEQVIASQPPVRFHVPDHRLDRGPASQLALDRRREATSLPGDEYPIRLGLVMPAIALVGVNACRLHFRHGHDLIDRRGEDMAVIRIARQCLGGEHAAFAVGYRQRNLSAEFVGPMRLALGDAHHFGRVQAVELVLARALLG